MGEDLTLFDFPFKIRVKGIFDFAGLLQFVHQWLTTNKFEYHETRYKDKLDTPLGTEAEIDVYGEKKLTEYYQLFIYVNYHFWESRDVQVVIDGKTVKRMQGRLDVRLNARLVTDWQKRFGKTALTRFFGMFLDDVVLKKERELLYVDVNENLLLEFNDQIKKFLKVEMQST
jgi:hypothetical protein